MKPKGDTPTAAVIDSLSHTHPISERSIKASLPEKFHADIPSTLTALTDTGHIIPDGPKTRRTYRLAKDTA